jgi:outer membrane lipoprotein-sorting protein
MSHLQDASSGLFRNSRGTAWVTLVFVLFAVSALCITGTYAVLAQRSPRQDEIARTLEQRGRNLTALKAIMGVSTVYDRGKSRQEVKGFLLYRRPSDFRFQGVGPAGNSLFEMVLKYNKFELYIPSDGKILKGGKRCFARRFPDVAELETLIPLVLLQWKTVRVTDVKAAGRDALVLQFNFKGTAWKATLERKNLLLRRLEKMGSRSVDLTADFGGYKSGEYGWLPRLFDVRSHSGGWRTIVKISKIEINPFLVEQNFKLETNFSAKVETCK